MHWIDWAVVMIPLAVVIWIAIVTQRYMRGVADFLAAGRAAGRYLVCNAAMEASYGAITIVMTFEILYQAGLAVGWWDQIRVPVMLLVTLSGFVIYRYRETRAMTLAQFFEMRYSRRFRIFMGMLAWIAGLINYGIFPAVAARFFVYFCGFPDTLDLGGWQVPTFAPVMLLLLGCALTFTLMGGQLTAMVTDCVEGLISGVMYVIVAAVLLYMFSWQEVSEALSNRPPGQSLINPFDTASVEDFNIWYILIAIFASVYGTMAWQGNQGFNCSAANPHEAKMGRILGQWRAYARMVMIVLLGLCAYTYMNHPDFAAGAGSVNQVLSGIENPQIQKQMRVPVALGHLLPIGIKGVFCSIVFFAMVAADSSYIHSWGSIFVQDVVLPFRKKHLDTKQHIRMLRWSIVGVAAFAFVFSLCFRQTEYIFMYFAITGAIFLGGAGAVIIGGLYWNKGTVSAAWSAMIVGSVLSVGGIVIRQMNPSFFLNGQWLSLIAMVSAVVVYIAVSLLTCKRDFDMDWLLHRGKYAVDEHGAPLAPVARPPRTWQTFLGIDSNFTRGDKFQSILLFSWSMFWFAAFLIITAWNLASPWPVQWWLNWVFWISIVMPFVVGIVTTIWFTIGGVRDLRILFQRLAKARRDEQDDGTVQRPPIAQERDERPATVAEASSVNR